MFVRGVVHSLLALAVITISCKKEYLSNSIGSMIMNDSIAVSWDRLSATFTDSTVFLNFDQLREGQQMPKLSLFFKNCRLKEAEQKVFTFANTSNVESRLVTLDEDVIGNFYDIVATGNTSTIKFSYIDKQAGSLTGNYRCIFVRDTSTPKYYADLADTIVINGEFKIYSN